MSEDNKPDQWAEQLAQFQRTIRDNEPMIRQIQQVQAMIRSGEAIRRQIEPIIKAAEQLTRSDGWPLPPFQRRLIRAVETAVREILPPRGPVLVTSGLLGMQGPDRAAVDHYLTVLSFALPIAVLIWSKQNKQK